MYRVMEIVKWLNAIQDGMKKVNCAFSQKWLLQFLVFALIKGFTLTMLQLEIPTRSLTTLDFHPSLQHSLLQTMVYRVIFIRWKFSDGWRICENFQCEIKFGCKKFLQTLPVSENFPRRIFPVQMLAVDGNYPIQGCIQKMKLGGQTETFQDVGGGKGVRCRGAKV